MPIKTLMDKSVSKSSCSEALTSRQDEEDSTTRRQDDKPNNTSADGALGDQIKNKLFGGVFGLVRK